VTRAQALEEARLRWGRAFGRVEVHHAGGNDGARAYQVGEWGAKGFEIHGEGSSWEAAFAAADGRAR